MKKLILFAILIGGLAGAGYGAVHLYNKYATASLIGLESKIPRHTLKERTVIDEIEVIGMVKARESMILYAPYNGKLSSLVPEGTFINEGEVVAEMDTTETEEELETELADLDVRKSNLEQAKAEYELLLEQNRLDQEASEAQLEYEKVALEDARRKFEEQRKLVEEELAAQSSLEAERLRLLQAELNLKEAEINLRKQKENQKTKIVAKNAEIEKARINLERVQREVEEEEKELEDSKIRAPRSGYVSYLYTWRGQRAKIAVGDQVWRRNGIIEIPDASQMEVVVPVNERDITRIQEGQPALVEIAAIPNETFRAEVVRKASVPISESNNPFGTIKEGVKEFEVFLGFSEQDPRFRQNMTATAEIMIARADNVFAVPQIAVFQEEGSQVRATSSGGPPPNVVAAMAEGGPPGRPGAQGPSGAVISGQGDGAEEAKEGAASGGKATSEQSTKHYVLVDKAGEIIKVPVKVGAVGLHYTEVTAANGHTLESGDQILLADPESDG